MRYAAIIHQEGTATLAEFPDCPGCQTFVRGKKRIEPVAREALEGWLGSHLVVSDKERRPDDTPPRPAVDVRAPRGKRILWIEVSAELTLKIELLWARLKAGLTRKQLAKRAGVPKRAIALLEDPAYRAPLDEYARPFIALGQALRVDLELVPEKGEHVVTGPMRNPSHPGELLPDMLRELKLSKAKAARRFGISETDLGELLKGKLTVTVELAQAIGDVAGNGPGLWLRMQHAHDLARLAALPTKQRAQS